jgi:hypothetical protein
MNSFLNKIGLIITNAVGTMICAILFALLALSGLPTALKPGGIGFVQWLSTAFLQLVLLSIIMVGAKLQSDNTIKHVTKQHKEHMSMVNKIHDLLKAKK